MLKRTWDPFDYSPHPEPLQAIHETVWPSWTRQSKIIPKSLYSGDYFTLSLSQAFLFASCRGLLWSRTTVLYPRGKWGMLSRAWVCWIGSRGLRCVRAWPPRRAQSDGQMGFFVHFVGWHVRSCSRCANFPPRVSLRLFIGPDSAVVNNLLLGSHRATSGHLTFSYSDLVM